MSRGRQAGADVVIDGVAAGHHGVVSAGDLGARGVGDRPLRVRVDAGLLGRAARGVYVSVAHAGRWTPVAVAQARWPALVATHRTAAGLYNLDGFDRPWLDPTEADLRVPWPGRCRVPGAPRDRTIGPGDITTIEGLRATTIVRTLLDLGEVVEVDLVERAVECALRTRLVVESDLCLAVQCAATAAKAARRNRGPQALATVIERRGPGQPPTGSDLETRFLQRVARPSHLEILARQVEVVVDDIWLARYDFLLAGWVIAEPDGSTHWTQPARQRNGWTDLRLGGLGVQVARCGFSDVTQRAVSLGRRLAELVDQGRRAHPRPPPLDGRILRLKSQGQVAGSMRSEWA